MKGFRRLALDPNNVTNLTYTVAHIHALPTYNLIMHSDREHRAALTSATGYIVVFKKSTSKEVMQKWKDDIVKDSEYLILHMDRAQLTGCSRLSKRAG